MNESGGRRIRAPHRQRVLISSPIAADDPSFANQKTRLVAPQSPVRVPACVAIGDHRSALVAGALCQMPPYIIGTGPSDSLRRRPAARFQLFEHSIHRHADSRANQCDRESS
jgi:hypothetical protein